MDAAKQYGPFAAAVVVGLAGFALGDWSLMAWLLAAAIACAGVVLQATRWGVLATAVLGLGSSGYLFSRKLESATGPSLCNVSDVVNCDVVNSSAASELFGIPIALLGAGYFLGVAVAALVAREANARLYQTTALLSVVGCLYSLYLAFESSRIGAVCVMCITIYLANGILLWAGIKGVKEEGRTLFDGLEKVAGSTSFVTTAATLVIVVLLGQTTWKSQKAAAPPLKKITGEAQPTGEPAPAPAPTEDLLSQLAKSYAAPRGPVLLDGDEPVLGDPNAKYTIVEFADYGCPHCAQAAVQLKQLVQQRPDVQVRFRPFALSGACNPAIEAKDGAERCRAAMAAECAHRQGKFWDYSGLVFQNQRDLSDNALSWAAEEVRLDMNAWAECMQDRETVRSVADSAVAGARAGVMGTPALFLKGTHGDQFVDVCWGPEGVLALIEATESGAQLPPPSLQSCHDLHQH